MFLPTHLKKIITFVISRSTVRVRQPAPLFSYIYCLKAHFLRFDYHFTLWLIWAFDRLIWAVLGSKYLELIKT